VSEARSLRHGDESELVHRCKGGERAAFDNLIRRYEDRIYNLCFHLVGDEEDALDLAQEAFVTCFQRIRQFEERSSFYTWLYRIVVNLSKNFRRYEERRARSKTESLDARIEHGGEELEKQFASSNPGPRDRVALKEEMELLEAGLQRLGEEFRAVLLLRYMEGLSYEEVAQVLGCSLGTVKSRISRARRELRELVRDVL
jgi:RNA polymerase sigma-70 factor (ECF subfamily)